MQRLIHRPLICVLTVVAVSNLVGCVSPSGRGGTRPYRDDGAPKVGEDAPRFTLRMLDDRTRTVELAALRNEKPVILFVGSYT